MNCRKAWTKSMWWLVRRGWSTWHTSSQSHHSNRGYTVFQARDTAKVRCHVSDDSGHHTNPTDWDNKRRPPASSVCFLSSEPSFGRQIAVRLSNRGTSFFRGYTIKRKNHLEKRVTEESPTMSWPFVKSVVDKFPSMFPYLQVCITYLSISK